MSFTKLNGWWRLVIFLSIVWAGWVFLVCIVDGLAPRMNSWLFQFVPDASDPLGLFPQLIWSRLFALVLAPIVLLWVTAGLIGWVSIGFLVREAAPLLKTGRLQDVLALIQVLALDKHAHRSASGLLSELQGPPRSADTWAEVAESHPEFFRIERDRAHGVSLVARHVLTENEGEVREFPVEFAGKLLGLAVELHDRQLRRAKAWEVFVPVLVALIAAAVGILGFASKQ